MAILAECPLCHNRQKAISKRCRKCGIDLDKFKRQSRVRYWVYARGPDGRQVKRAVGSFGDLKATKIEDARKADALLTVQKEEKRPLFNKAPGADLTFEKLAEWYRELPEVQKLKSFDRIKLILANFNAVHGELLVNDLILSHLTGYQQKRKDDKRSPRTIDYEISVVKTMVTRAYHDDKIDGKPTLAFKRVKRKCKSGSNARDRTLSPAEYLLLVEHAGEHLKPILITAYHTGMRLGELLKLRWHHVDKKAGMIVLPKEIVKTGKPRRIPIGRHVAAVLLALPFSKAHDYVFTYRGRRIATYIKKSLMGACERAGLPYGRKTTGGLTFHDIRRTVKTGMLAAGIDRAYRDKLLGHVLSGMDKHYISPTDAQLKAAMAKYTSWIEAELEKATYAQMYAQADACHAQPRRENPSDKHI